MKKIIITIIILFNAITLAHADHSPAAMRFINTPDAVWKDDDHKPEKISAIELTKEAIEFLAAYPWNGDYENPTLPKEFNGYRLDLNKDGSKEYFIDIEPFGGSGGPFFIILGKIKSHWVVIGDFQGSFCLLPLRNGWHQIAIISRGGAENYSKQLFIFSGGKYQQKSIQNFEHGKITKRDIEQTYAPDKK